MFEQVVQRQDLPRHTNFEPKKTLSIECWARGVLIVIFLAGVNDVFPRSNHFSGLATWIDRVTGQPEGHGISLAHRISMILVAPEYT